MKKYLFASAILALGLATGRLAAAPIDADPNQKYDITPAAGNWMICAASYSGADAPDIAHRLVLDIRRAYNLPAFVFNHGAEERRKQEERIAQIRALCPEGRVRIERIEEQVAVLVGGYKDMDSARKAVDGIKKLKPLDNRAMDTVTWQEKAVQNGQEGIVTKTGYVSPFMRSFVVRNPTVSADQVQQDHGPDPFLKQLNNGETYSVYKCRKPFTMAVAVFQSPTVIQSDAKTGIFDKLWNSDAASDRLTASAMSAHNLAEVLSHMGYDAYVFHTRYNSVVCVGGYERSDDPNMARTAAALRDRMKVTMPVASVGPDGKKQELFLSNPLPMEVPH